jgi:hypothetical protein
LSWLGPPPPLSGFLVSLYTPRFFGCRDMIKPS